VIARPVSQNDIDRAREHLERCNFKLGKARSRAIMSQAQATADATDLQACVAAAAAAENEFASLAERFVAPSLEAETTLAITYTNGEPIAEQEP
jgi:hypothetical protein